jgi:hypothetical protein
MTAPFGEELSAEERALAELIRCAAQRLLQGAQGEGMEAKVMVSARKRRFWFMRRSHSLYWMADPLVLEIPDAKSVPAHFGITVSRELVVKYGVVLDANNNAVTYWGLWGRQNLQDTWQKLPIKGLNATIIESLMIKLGGLLRIQV